MSATYDPMAIAIDWLDAYRAARVETMLDLYDDDASLECGGGEIIVGKRALKQYWIQCFARMSPLELDDIQPLADGVALAYQSGQGLVRVVFSFNAEGKIACTCCTMSAETMPLCAASR